MAHMEGSLRDHVERAVAYARGGDSMEAAVIVGVRAVGDWLAENPNFGHLGVEQQTVYIARVLREYK